jgi:DNA segregation ATPase FtsK/SpoIIIE, S-DNA-T family
MSRRQSTTRQFFAALAALVGGLFQLLKALFQILAALCVVLTRAAIWLAGRLHALADAIPTKKTLQAPSAPAALQAPAQAPAQAPLFQMPAALPRTLHEAPRLSLVAPPTRPTVAPATTGFRVDLLTPQSGAPARPRDEAKLALQGKLLLDTLRHFGVQGEISSTFSGPTVATFQIIPAPGTKVSKVAGLDDDLSLALGRKVRILLPMPGTNRLGFEVANEVSANVALRDILTDERFLAAQATKALPVALGRDTLGRPVIADLAAMPHVIVAGETGSGKSVGLNVMLLSLLFSKSPADLKLLMIDPKAVELTPYNGLPHMLRPVVTDMDRAAEDLTWAVDEMERRYQLFAAAGTKNLASYNAQAPTSGKLASVVIVIDEFADLVLSNKQVEKLVIRLAQKARAAGIHMILATQRPSMNVITGTLKANCPTRIAFRVADGVNSRIILDEQGAENLLGRGDALVKMNGETKRVQCPWVSEDEIAHVTRALRSGSKAA